MTNLYEIYQVIASPEHIWRFENTDTYIKRATLHLAGVELTDEVTDLFKNIMDRHRNLVNGMRLDKEKWTTEDHEKTNELFLYEPLKAIKL